MTFARIQVDRGEYVYLADKYGFESALCKDAIRLLMWDVARYDPEISNRGSGAAESSIQQQRK